MSVKSKTYTKDEVEIDYADFEDINLETTSNNTLLPGLYSAKNLVPEEITSMVEFDMMQSSSPANPATTTIDQEFLRSVANCERGNTRDICARIPEVDRIC